MAIIFLIAAVVSVLQWTVVSYAALGLFSFDLQLITLVFFSVRRGFKTGLALGIFFGVFNGIFGITAFWANVFIYATICFASEYAAKWFYRQSLFTCLLILILAAAAF
ncbi:MAG: hypothetical protein NTV07_07625, partial [Candidatus Omnitrophica bacterium]|nr:hypothetical protein [Candidatus Omnitrophota bacterium]